MPRIYRAMKQDAGRPMLGASGSTLGVRTPGGAGRPDIEPDEEGHVWPATGGMSVSPSLRDLLARLPARMIPQRLRHLAPKAAGSNHVLVWRMGEGPFVAAPLTDRLALRPDPEDSSHGFVEPGRRMSLEAYAGAVAATRDEWVVDEEAGQT